jgi:hypothetical protein
MYANESPGAMAIVQTATSRYRKVALKNFRFGIITTSALDSPLEPDESIANRTGHFSRPVHDMRVRFYSN